MDVPLLSMLLVWVSAAQILLLSCCHVTAQLSRDKDLLLAFKATFDNGNEVLVDWNEEDASPCPGNDTGFGWTGIWCEFRQVTDM